MKNNFIVLFVFSLGLFAPEAKIEKWVTRKCDLIFFCGYVNEELRFCLAKSSGLGLNEKLKQKITDQFIKKYGQDAIDHLVSSRLKNVFAGACWTCYKDTIWGNSEQLEFKNFF